MLAAGVLAACSGTTDMVDGKAVVDVPTETTVIVEVDGTPTPSPSPTVARCYLLEIERTSNASGEETEENYQCVSKEVYDKNHVEEEYKP